MSRLLIITALSKSGVPFSKEEVDKFLIDSGFDDKRDQLLSSLSMKKFYQLLESKVNEDHSNELEFVSKFLSALEQEVFADVSAFFLKL